MILVTAGSDVLDNDNDLVLWRGKGKISNDELLTHKGVDGIVCGDERYDREMLAHFTPNLKVISRAGAGWDNIDQAAAQELGIKVFRQEGAYAEAVADSTLAMILAFARRLISLNNSMHKGEWKREKYPGVCLRETTIGIIGLGHIGKQVLDRVKVFGGSYIVYHPSRPDKEWPLETLLKLSDFVTIHCALVEETRHLIGEKELNQMKPNAYLINTSRGGLIDTTALVKALSNGTIAGAGLDVFEEEPLPVEHVLRGLDNVILTPHNAYWSPQERRAVVHGAVNVARSNL